VKRKIVDINSPDDVAKCDLELKQWINRRKINHKTFFDMISGAGTLLFSSVGLSGANLAH
jgi:hypothetical protein